MPTKKISKYEAFLVISLWFCNIADAIFTWVAVATGNAIEANPAQAFLIELGYDYFLFEKFLTGWFIVYFSTFMVRLRAGKTLDKITKWALSILAFPFMFLILWYTFNFIQRWNQFF